MPHRIGDEATESMRCFTLVATGFERRVDRFRSSSRLRAERNPKKVRALFLVRRETRSRFEKKVAPDARPFGRRFADATCTVRPIRATVAVVDAGRACNQVFAISQAICRGFFVLRELRRAAAQRGGRASRMVFGAGEAPSLPQRGARVVNKDARSVLTLAKHVISFAQQQLADMRETVVRERVEHDSTRGLPDASKSAPADRLSLSLWFPAVDGYDARDADASRAFSYAALHASRSGQSFHST